MEHLTRNTNNDRIINAISSVKLEQVDSLNKQLEELANKTVTVFTGILSSLISGVLVSIVKQEGKVGIEKVWLPFLFIVLLFIVWFMLIKKVIPFLSRFLFTKKVDVGPEQEFDIVKQFNYDFMQKIAEINEIVDVIQQTKIAECKMLNFVIALNKLEETVCFLHETFVDNKTTIRNTLEDGPTILLRYSFNRYTVSAVVKTLTHIQDAMIKIIENDRVIKGLDGFDLLVEDFNQISGQINDLKKI